MEEVAQATEEEEGEVQAPKEEQIRSTNNEDKRQA